MKRPGPFLEDSPAFRCPGHVGVAGAPGGGLLLAYHAYARDDPGNRQFLIAPLHFDADGWPAVGPSTNRAASAAPARFDFGRDDLGQGWQWPVGPRPAARTLRGGSASARVLAQQAGTSTFSARTVVSGARRGARPGLAVMPSPTTPSAWSCVAGVRWPGARMRGASRGSAARAWPAGGPWSCA